MNVKLVLECNYFFFVQTTVSLLSTRYKIEQVELDILNYLGNILRKRGKWNMKGEVITILRSPHVNKKSREQFNSYLVKSNYFLDNYSYSIKDLTTLIYYLVSWFSWYSSEVNIKFFFKYKKIYKIKYEKV